MTTVTTSKGPPKFMYTFDKDTNEEKKEVHIRDPPSPKPIQTLDATRDSVSRKSSSLDLRSYSKKEVAYLLKFIPQTILSFILKYPTNKEFATPMIETIETVVMFADVSWFTQICELYSECGSFGTEQMAFNINRYFEQLVKIIRSDGGDIVKFAGDALFVVWPKDRSEKLHSAVHCALEIQRDLKEMALNKNINLCVKIGIGFGETMFVHLGGGKAEKYHYTIYGDAVRQALYAESYAKKGDVILSVKAMNAMKSTPKEYEFVNEKRSFVKILSAQRMTKKKSSYTKQSHFEMNYSMHRIEKYIANQVIETLKYKEWINENRSVCVMFLNVRFEANKNEKKKLDLDLLQNTVVCIQDIMKDFGGYLNKFIFDDKGSTFLSIFGLPPNTNDEDCSRAVLCAMHVQTVLIERFSLKSSIGISCGDVYCGLLGTTTFREYGVMSDCVNLSARLMAAAKGRWGIYCSEWVMENASSSPNLQFVLESSQRLKGKKHLVEIWSPHQNHIDNNLSLKYWRNIQVSVHHSELDKRDSLIMDLGNREVVENICSVTDNAVKNDKGSVQLIIGVKTVEPDLMLANVEKYYETKHILHFVYGCNVSFDFGQFVLWKRIFLSILQNELRIFVFSRQFCELMSRLIQNIAPDLLVKLPAICPLVECEIEENKWSKNATSDEKFDAMVEILVVIFEKVTELFPLMICISDLEYQCIDDCKLSRVILAKKLDKIHFIMTSTPEHAIGFTVSAYSASKQFVSDLETKYCDNVIHLKAWDREETTVALLTFFNVWSISEHVINYLMLKCNGLCGLIIPFCAAIKDEFMLVNGELSCPFIQSLIENEAVSDFDTPTSIKRYYHQLIDTLSVTETVILKAASVICKGNGSLNLQFETNILFKLFGLINRDISAEEIEKNLVKLEETDFIHRTKRNFYSFDNGLLLDTVYNMMLHRQRRKLHDSLTGIYTKRCSIKRSSHVQKEVTKEEKIRKSPNKVKRSRSMKIMRKMSWNKLGSKKNLLAPAQETRQRTISSENDSAIPFEKLSIHQLNHRTKLHSSMSWLDLSLFERAKVEIINKTERRMTLSSSISQTWAPSNSVHQEVIEEKWRLAKVGVLMIYVMNIESNAYRSKKSKTSVGKLPNFYVSLVNNSGKHKAKTSIRHGQMKPKWNEYLSHVVSEKLSEKKKHKFPIYELQLRHSDVWKDVEFGSVELPLADIHYLLSSSSNHSQTDAMHTSYIEKKLKLEINKKYGQLFDVHLRKERKMEEKKMFLNVKIAYVSVEYGQIADGMSDGISERFGSFGSLSGMSGFNGIPRHISRTVRK